MERAASAAEGTGIRASEQAEWLPVLFRRQRRLDLAVFRADLAQRMRAATASGVQADAEGSGGGTHERGSLPRSSSPWIRDEGQQQQVGERQEEQRPQSKAAALREKLLRLEAQAKEEDKQEKGEVSSNATTVMTDDIPDDADPPHVIICASGEACNSKRTADKNALINFFEDEENPGTWYCEACWGEDEEQAEDAEKGIDIVHDTHRAPLAMGSPPGGKPAERGSLARIPLEDDPLPPLAPHLFRVVHCQSCSLPVPSLSCIAYDVTPC